MIAVEPAANGSMQGLREHLANCLNERKLHSNVYLDLEIQMTREAIHRGTDTGQAVFFV